MNTVEIKCTEEHIENSVKEVMKCAKEEELGDVPILLQFNSFEVVKKPIITRRINLTHSIMGDNLAFVVADLPENPEKTIEHWESILCEKNVKSIKKIVLFNEIETNFIEKRKLIRSYDGKILADSKIAIQLSNLLGKKVRKPIPVMLYKKNLKGEFEHSMKKTIFTLHGSGCSHIVHVARTSMSEENIVDNIVQAVIEIKKVYPGGANNIRSILLQIGNGAAVRIFSSIANKVPSPVVVEPRKRARKRKTSKTVQGEPPSKKKQNGIKS